MRRITTAIAAAAIVLAACTAGTGATPTPTIPIRPRPGVATQLVPFDRCEAVIDWIVGNAVDLVGPYGFEGWAGTFFWRDATTTMAAAEDASVGGASPPITSTNLQEAGVDEADLVKTDGNRIVVVSGQRLHVLTIDGGDLVLHGSIDLPVWSEQLYLAGDRVTAIASAWNFVPLGMPEMIDGDIAPFPQQPKTTVVEVDISDPAEPTLLRTLEMDGRPVSSRLVDGAIRLVVSSGPTGFAWVMPEGSGLRAEREAEQANRRLVLDSTIDNWLPYYVLSDGAGTVLGEGTVTDCSRVSRPEDFSGLTALSLVTLSPEGLDIADATSVFADGDIVYASEQAAYVATTSWDDLVAEDGNDAATEIHRFSLTDRSAAYTGSGEVNGYLLNQFAMSEFEGHLRVASTSQPAWWGNGGDSESAVTVLRIDDTALTPVGSISGLGEGERIYSVRFIADTGYVVTFRQVDPLYVIDLSDPTAPRTAGELKIPGYSAYLHPIGEGTLLGVGQDADEDGRTVGAQVSLFDVADPASPQRIDQHLVKDAWSEVEADHHAFLFDAAHGIAVVPLQRWWMDDGTPSGEPQSVALVLSVNGSSIDEIGAVDHGGGMEWAPPIRRSLVIGDVLVTVSEAGVMSSAIADLAELDHVEF